MGLLASLYNAADVFRSRPLAVAALPYSAVLWHWYIGIWTAGIDRGADAAQ